MTRNFVWPFLILSALQMSAQAPLPEFFAQRGVEEVRIQVAPEDWATLQKNYLENTFYRATFEWRGQRWTDVGIRSRGGGTRSAVKPALRVDFGRYTSAQRFQGMRNIAIENLEQDAPMMREYLSMALFRARGIAAPREVYIHMFVNGRDMGLHLAMEHFDAGFVQRALGPDAGGDLYEYQWVDHWNWHLRGNADAHYAPEPFEIKTNERTANQGRVRELVEALAVAQTETFDELVGRQLDVENVIRYFAVEAFLADADGLVGGVGTNNFYFYRRPRDGKFLFMAWDKDSTMSNYERALWHGVPESELLRKLLDVPEYRQRFLGEMAELVRFVEADGAWLSRLAEETERMIRPYGTSDPVKRFTAAEYEFSVETVLHFLRERPRILRQLLEREWVRVDP